MAVDWTNVLVALIAGVPAIIGAIAGAILVVRTKTPSGTGIGKQVENALHTALANNYHLRSIGGTVAAPSPPEAQAQEEIVPGLPGGNE